MLVAIVGHRGGREWCGVMVVAVAMRCGDRNFHIRWSGGGGRWREGSCEWWW